MTGTQPPDLIATLAALIRGAKEATGESQKDLAARSGVDQATISRVVSGAADASKVTSQTATRLLLALGVRPAQLGKILAESHRGISPK